MGDALPASVAGTLDRYMSHLDQHAPDALTGLYLVGSVALDDYREGCSDIDFVALLRRPIDSTMVAALNSVHAAMGDARPYLDGIYLDAEMLSSLPVTPSVVPRSLEGTFQICACFETNPAVWLCLARHGVRVRGADPAELRIPHDPLHLRRFLIGNLQTYWTQWIAECRAALALKRPGEDGNAAALAWGVLGTARIACTLATGRIVSKRAAGEWALATYPARHQATIYDALAARREEVSRFSVPRFEPALAFMEMLIERETPGATSSA